MTAHTGSSGTTTRMQCRFGVVPSAACYRADRSGSRQRLHRGGPDDRGSLPYYPDGIFSLMSETDHNANSGEEDHAEARCNCTWRGRVVHGGGLANNITCGGLLSVG